MGKLFASGPAPRDEACRGYRRGLDGPSVPKPNKKNRMVCFPLFARQHASHEERLPGACDGESSAASTGVPGVARAARFVI